MNKIKEARSKGKNLISESFLLDNSTKGIPNNIHIMLSGNFL
jgi:hypothetical protein